MARQLWLAKLRRHGNKIGRKGMSDLVIKAVSEFDGSYKGAMVLAGRLKAVGQMAQCDHYWKEKVDIGFHRELDLVLQSDFAALSKAEGRSLSSASGQEGGEA